MNLHELRIMKVEQSVQRFVDEHEARYYGVPRVLWVLRGTRSTKGYEGLNGHCGILTAHCVITAAPPIRTERRAPHQRTSTHGPQLSIRVSRWGAPGRLAKRADTLEAKKKGKLRCGSPPALAVCALWG